MNFVYFVSTQLISIDVETLSVGFNYIVEAYIDNLMARLPY